jgi:hypothetical protein
LEGGKLLEVLSGLKLLHIYFIDMTNAFHCINKGYILCNLYTFFIDCSDIQCGVHPRKSMECKQSNKAIKQYLFVCWNCVVYIAWSQLIIVVWRSHFWRVILEIIQSFLIQNSFENMLFSCYLKTLDQIKVLFDIK